MNCFSLCHNVSTVRLHKDKAFIIPAGSNKDWKRTNTTVSDKQLIITLSIRISKGMSIVFKENNLPLRFYSCLGFFLPGNCVWKQIVHHNERHVPGNTRHAITNNNPVSGFTFKTVSSKLSRWFWKASLVFETIHGPDAKQTSPALQPGYCDRMSDAAVREPAIVTSIQTEPPGSVKLSRVCQDSIFPLTLCIGFFKSHFVANRCKVHFTWNTDGKMQQDV